MTGVPIGQEIGSVAPSTTFLFRVEAQLDGTAPIVLRDAPLGTRVIAAVSAGSVRGPRVNGTLVPELSADWVTIRADRLWELDVRAVFTTDDGAAILYHYTGIATHSGDGLRAIRGTPRFETSDERYSWLNAVQAVAIGETDPRTRTVFYDIYALD
jgi:hypothetical protein